MLRLLFYLFLGYLAYRVVRLLLLPAGSPRRKKRGRGHEAEEMAACARCGTYVSKGQAITKGGQIFCGPNCS